jgi:phosphohistidine phosphatase SixA
MRWTESLTLALAIGLIAGTAQAEPPTIYVMRHLERDSGRDPDLNATGRTNAQRLATWFKRDPPRAIFVTQFRRAQQTAAPLAARTKLTPVVYDANAPEQMLAAVKSAKTPVLIIGHTNTLPRILEALGGPKASGDLAEADYGRIWILRRSKLAVARLAEPQPR